MRKTSEALQAVHLVYKTCTQFSAPGKAKKKEIYPTYNDVTKNAIILREKGTPVSLICNSLK